MAFDARSLPNDFECHGIVNGRAEVDAREKVRDFDANGVFLQVEIGEDNGWRIDERARSTIFEGFSIRRSTITTADVQIPIANVALTIIDGEIRDEVSISTGPVPIHFIERRWRSFGGIVGDRFFHDRLGHTHVKMNLRNIFDDRFARHGQVRARRAFGKSNRGVLARSIRIAGQIDERHRPRCARVLKFILVQRELDVIAFGVEEVYVADVEAHVAQSHRLFGVWAKSGDFVRATNLLTIGRRRKTQGEGTRRLGIVRARTHIVRAALGREGKKESTTSCESR